MTKVEPFWFYSFGHYLKALLYLRADLPKDVKLHILAYARIGLTVFTSDPRYKNLLPKSSETAQGLMEQIDVWTGLKKGEFGPRTDRDISKLHDWVKDLSAKLETELDNLHVYCVTETGGLSVETLIRGYSEIYPKDTLALCDDFIKKQIDEAGRCLAFERPTACGFHILRSVEIMIKAYLLAVTGSFPPMNRRNWGEYIEWLEKAGASKDMTDVLHVLKRKRNPLMHPQEDLTMDDAVDVFTVCRSGANAVVADVRSKSLDAAFTQALATLPTI